MSQNQSATRTQHTRKARLPAVRRLALAAPVAGLALAAAVIPAGMASARGGSFPTTTTVSSSENPSGFRTLVTYTAAIKYWVLTPTGWIGNPVNPGGTVSFTDNGTPITGCTAVPDSGGGTATCQAFLSLGTHTVAATYAPEQAAYGYLGSTGTMTQKVIW